MVLNAFRERLEAYNQAGQRLHPWFAGALSLAFLRAAIDSGLLDIMDQPRTVQDIADHLQLEEPWALKLCQTLFVLGVFDRKNNFYYLSSDYARLLAPNSPLSLTDALGFFEVLIQETSHLFSPKRAYTRLSSEDKLKVARGKWGTPSSILARRAFQQFSEQMPEVTASWNTRASHLELGCGTGRDLLCIASLYPSVEVTGVDINEDVLLHVKREAQALRLSKRVNLIHADARTLDYQEAFDTVLWSQIFFPMDTRESTIEVSHRSLKPGGYLLLPLQHDFSNATDQLRTSGNGLPLLIELIYRHWELNPRHPDDIRKEAEQVGFEFVRLVSAPYYFAMLLHKPFET